MKEFGITKKQDNGTLQCFLEQNKEIKNIEKKSSSFTRFKIDGVGLPTDFSYYSGIPLFWVSYISDIHLEHHYDKSGSISSFIEKTVRNLWNSVWNLKSGQQLILFTGDISSIPEITISFFTRFIKYFQEKQRYIYYKNIKKLLLDLKVEKETFKTKKENYIKRIERFEKYIKTLKSGLLPEIRFGYMEKDKEKNYRYLTWKEYIKLYKDTKRFKNKRISEDYEFKLDSLIEKLDQLEKLKDEYERFLSQNEEYTKICSFLRKEFRKNIKNITIEMILSKDFGDECDYESLFNPEYYNLCDLKRVIFVLGNHEYMGFDSVDDAVKYYKEMLEPLGIDVLQNEIIEGEINKRKYVFYGGSGFAKYNLEYNADTLYGCKDFSRKDEIYETEKFERKYTKAKQYAKEKNACFICASHYPILDCMKSIDKDTIYFYGHNHKNYYKRDENAIIYANNQIGYKNNRIEFKSTRFGIVPDPYAFLDNGLHKTTLQDYLMFYERLGEDIGSGSLIKRMLETGDLFVMKDNSYYGFFIIDEQKGIYIVNGGQRKKISKFCDLEWLEYNFSKVLLNCLKGMLPYRLVQEKISEELRELGFIGDVHGCIVDITKYYHIMLNPFNARIYFYSYFDYNSKISVPEIYDTFEETINSLCENQRHLFEDENCVKKLKEKIDEKKKDKNSIIGRCTSNKHFLDGAKRDDLLKLQNIENNKEIILHDLERAEMQDIYNVSRRINSLQKLFSSRVLRFFDQKMCDTMPQKQLK